MSVTVAVLVLARSAAVLADETPEPDDVVAGWLGAVVFVVLILAVVLLGLSLVKQLRKAQAAKDAGVYGDPPPPDEDRADGDRPVSGG